MNYQSLYEKIKDADDKLASANAETSVVRPQAARVTWGSLLETYGNVAIGWKAMVTQLAASLTDPGQIEAVDLFQRYMLGNGVAVGNTSIRSMLAGMKASLSADAGALIDLMLSLGTTTSTPALDTIGREASETDITRAILIGERIETAEAEAADLIAQANDLRSSAYLFAEHVEQWDGAGDAPTE